MRVKGPGGRRDRWLGVTVWMALIAAALLAACSPAASWRLLPASGMGSLPPDLPPDLPALPTPRRALGAAVYAGFLYAAGGWNGESTQLSTVEIFDPAVGRWADGPPLTVARSQHSLISSGDQLWAVAGWSADGGLASAVEVLDAGSGVWRTETHLPTPRREPGVAFFDGEIVVAGGFDGWNDAEQDGYSALVEAYDPVLHRWRRLASLGQPRRGLSLVAAGGSLYAIGGYGPGAAGFLNTVERYDPPADRWERLDWVITPRTWAAAVAIPAAQGPATPEQAILIAGGFNQAGFLDRVERVDPASGRVCLPPPLAGPRAWAAAVLLDARVLLVGGETPDGFSGTLEEVAGDCAR